MIYGELAFACTTRAMVDDKVEEETIKGMSVCIGNRLSWDNSLMDITSVNIIGVCKGFFGEF